MNRHQRKGGQHVILLTSANFGYDPSSWDTTYGTYEMGGITYDNDGNLTALFRDSSGTSAMDNLVYRYRPGTDLDTLITNSAGAGSAYTYDSNGNVISDSRNGIAFIIYNVDNEPLTVYKTNGSVYWFNYDVDGTRVGKNMGGGTYYVFYANGPDGKTEVADEVPYGENITINLWANGDNIGQVRNNSGSVSHYYYLKDHLGDIKMVLNSGGAVDSYNDYYPFGEQMPGRNLSGSSDGRYKYTSKERDVETGLDYFGARYYDSWRGQWLSVDPMEDLHPDYTPYAYVYNNPLLLIDPEGRDSTQRAEAVAEANKYVEKNPNKDRNLYEYGAKGAPGQPTDCSGLTSNCVVTSGVADPNRGTKNGVANTVDNTKPVDVKEAQPGNLVVFRSKLGTPSQHIGILVKVQQNGSKTTFTMVQSGVHTGPDQVTFTPGTGPPGSFGATFQGARAWDTPDQIRIWSSTPTPVLFQTVVSDQTYVGH